MEFRPMTIADYDGVHQLWTDISGIGLRSFDDSRGGIERFLNRNPGISCVAVGQGGIVGAVLCGHDGRRGYLYHLAVREDFRGRGVGRTLVSAALDALEREGITKAALMAFTTNEVGNHFWESLGFEARGDLVYRSFSLNSRNV